MPVACSTSVPGWTDPYNPSPVYSSSAEEYPSPHADHGDVGSFFPGMLYSQRGSRTRTPSNASMQGHWDFTPQSPSSSSISTMPYTWATNENMPTPSTIAFINTSYTMGGYNMPAAIDATLDYEKYGPRTMMQRNVEEKAILFQEQPYGTGQLTQSYKSEQFLNNYWRLFHPTFPIIHRPSFRSIASPPLLRAAMIAVGAQYSTDTSTKHRARKLHDLCLKVLEIRKQKPMAEADCLADYQAIFLIEVLSQYRSRRAAKKLSSPFKMLYDKAMQECNRTMPQLNNIILSLEQKVKATHEDWTLWSELAVWQRLLASCYILESEQAILLARHPRPSQCRQPGADLPFPVNASVWNANTLDEWDMALRQNHTALQYVDEARPGSVLALCDNFQSSLLIAVHYNKFEMTSPYVNAPVIGDMDDMLDMSFATRLRLLISRLVQVTPIRALLAVSGDSWILSEKVSSPQTQVAFTTELRTWLKHIWSTQDTRSQPVASKEAVDLAVQILEMAMREKMEGFEVNMGLDMGVYFAAMVLWAVTAEYTHKMEQHATYADFSQPPSFIDHHDTVIVTTEPHELVGPFTALTTSTKDAMHTSFSDPILGQSISPTRHDSLEITPMLSHEDIMLNMMTFLPAIRALGSTAQCSSDLGMMQTCCSSMLLWTKLELGGATHDNQDMLSMWAGISEKSHGELLNSVVGSIERILNGGTTRWDM
ncbi:hypothetical protein ACEQ8H_003262 [Pleosporales sp. CAS-2024a]